MYKAINATLAAAGLFIVAGVSPAQARVNVDVHIGVPVVAAPAPPPVAVVDTGYYRPDPWPAPRQEIYFEEPPRFIFSPRLGFYVSVGIPYDIAYVNNGYYLYRGGNWYGAPSYSGPWNMVSYRRLPHALRQHRYEEICHHRDYEYRSYLRDRGRYRGTWYQPVRVEYRDHHRERWEDRKDHRWKERDGRWKDGDRRWKDRDGHWKDGDRRWKERDGYRGGRGD